MIAWRWSCLDKGSDISVGQVWRGDVGGPSVVVVRDARVVDITCRAFPTMRDLLEQDDPAALVKAADGQELGALADIAAASIEPKDGAGGVHLLAPCDLQAVKACGVTFARSMIERVIEEQAEGDPALAQKVRERVSAIVGDSLATSSPVRRRLQESGRP